MLRNSTDQRFAWLVAGIVAGMCISYFWPHEPVGAVTTMRGDKFALVTVDLPQSGGTYGQAVFVLDFLTGVLTGSALNNRIEDGRFGYFYQKDVGADFDLDPNVVPQFAVVSGVVTFGSVASVSGFGASVIRQRLLKLRGQAFRPVALPTRKSVQHH